MKMKTNKINEILLKIYEGNYCSSDIGLLFLWLRPVIGSDGKNLLSDLANFLAHSDERDRGISYNHIHSYTDNFLAVSAKGGSIIGLKPVFNQKTIIESLCTTLNTPGVNLNKDKLAEQAGGIVNCLIDLMEETEFKFNEPRVKRCYLKRDGKKMFFCLNLNLAGPVIKVTPSTTIQVPLFD